MWSIKRIFYYNPDTGDSHVLMARNSKPTKNKNSDLIRYWICKQYPDKKDYPEELKKCQVNRIHSWLSGRCESTEYEKVGMQLMEQVDGIKLSVYEPPKETTILVSGHLPCILPAVTYNLKLKKSKTNKYTQSIVKILGMEQEKAPPVYRVVDIDWINVAPLNSKILLPFITWFSNSFKQRGDWPYIRDNKVVIKKNVMLKVFIKSQLQNADWSTITRENYHTDIMKLISHSQGVLRHFSAFKRKELRKIFYPYMDTLPLKLLCYMDYRWIQVDIPSLDNCPNGCRSTQGHIHNSKCVEKAYADKTVEIRAKWDRIAANPERILLQGEDYCYRADINDYKRLCISLGRTIPDQKDLDELEDANKFVKSLGRSQVCKPIKGERTRSTKYVHKVGNKWATSFDIDNTKKIVEWLKDVPFCMEAVQDKHIDEVFDVVDYETQVVVKHPDDKLIWWTLFPFQNVVTTRTAEHYVIGNAHNFTQEDWLEFAKGPKPLMIFGRVDVETSVRGHVFQHYARSKFPAQCAIKSYPVLSNIIHMKYADACKESWVNAQVYVSTKDEKQAFSKFPPATKLKRKWMFNPKRIVTEQINNGVMLWVRESDGREVTVQHRIINTPYADANIICPWESYQQVSTAILICTKNTRPEDIYRVRTYATLQVILVETQGCGAPSLDYDAGSSLKSSLINVQ
jgi:hypothetical protein